MKKVLFLLAILPMMLFTACSSGDDSNEYESALVGSWVTDDNDIEVNYLELKSDKTGKLTCTYDGEIERELDLVWSATKNQITMISKGAESEILPYVLSGKHLQINDRSYARQ